MRTTVTLDKDVAAAVQQLQRDRLIGLSAAVNELARAGLAASTQRKRFVQRSVAMGAGLDVSNVAEALELLEGPGHR
ncbi:MAG: CopG family transcriptional regulator [Geodermatophilaceae bacterium]|nr:CopG family transcriptional regulator [Geodermatophilaceae bacterium]